MVDERNVPQLTVGSVLTVVTRSSVERVRRSSGVCMRNARLYKHKILREQDKRDEDTPSLLALPKDLSGNFALTLSSKIPKMPFSFNNRDEAHNPSNENSSSTTQ